jgi:hypothetical protein
MEEENKKIWVLDSWYQKLAYIAGWISLISWAVLLVGNLLGL